MTKNFYRIFITTIILASTVHAEQDTTDYSDIDLPTIGSIDKPYAIQYSADIDKVKQLVNINVPSPKIALSLESNYSIPSPNFRIPSVPRLQFSRIPNTIFTPEEERELASIQYVIADSYTSYIEKLPEPIAKIEPAIPNSEKTSSVMNIY